MEGWGAVWALVRLFAPYGWMGITRFGYVRYIPLPNLWVFILCCWIGRSCNAVPS